jgi:hypothetical protein
MTTKSENYIRYSSRPVEAGMIQFVRSPIAGEGAAACVVTQTLPTKSVYDPENQCWIRSYPYRMRRATTAEEQEYLALLAPRSAGIGLGAAAHYRAIVDGK